MVATGFSGPRRLGSGTLKDLIIGAGYVRGDGLVAKAGGMLVKNVSGFEIPRFLHGSWGSLAVITSVNLKVIPKPKADVTFVHREVSLGTSLAAQIGILQRHPGVAAVVTEKRDDGWIMAIRLLGRQASIDAQLQSFRDELGSDTEVQQGNAWWDAYNGRWAAGDGDVRLVVGGRAEVLHRLAMEFEQLDALNGLSVSLGTGTVRIALKAHAFPRPELVARLGAHPVTWIIESAPAVWRGRETVWGPEREDRSLAQSIKHQFDPANILNRGRLFT
jgi:glycolate oxidase FAD binding subunit